MKLLLFSTLLQLIFAQFYYQQPRIPQRTLMYPVRTNCQYVWCNQNRYRWNYRPTEFINPCPSGRPLVNEFNTPISCNYLNQPNAGCPEEYWCHTVNRCEMRRDTGEGSELVARWYYDKQAKQCRRFLYKGIRGNANNFVTKTQCVDACDTSIVVDRTNPCRIGNPASHRNQSRIVCGPNDSSTCPRNYYCHLGETPETTACCESMTDLCLLALNVGQGKALLKR
ncbi:Kunitz/Bovine pancreatic trypsin inhibitor domain protein [Ancylostoma caninum]|uniref:Kunitz/Bovine pancreatic trypsin inhibitor domain protein n=1 Tax=Ancylostoma caninum TaxID=29170 RepID=A0A368GA56_ANCCA|nr:Kunitz/Bovine pancreatic trypsin inhibitor domain protein [Ancylostoma caninum]